MQHGECRERRDARTWWRQGVGCLAGGGRAVRRAEKEIPFPCVGSSPLYLSVALQQRAAAQPGKPDHTIRGGGTSWADRRSGGAAWHWRSVGRPSRRPGSSGRKTGSHRLAADHKESILDPKIDPCQSMG
jgi:hypothetical protein